MEPEGRFEVATVVPTDCALCGADLERSDTPAAREAALTTFFPRVQPLTYTTAEYGRTQASNPLVDPVRLLCVFASCRVRESSKWHRARTSRLSPGVSLNVSRRPRPDPPVERPPAVVRPPADRGPPAPVRTRIPDAAPPPEPGARARRGAGDGRARVAATRLRTLAVNSPCIGTTRFGL